MLTPVAIAGVPEPVLRVGVFLLILVSLLAFERLWPRRSRCAPTASRWLTNVSMTALASLLTRALAWAVPATAATAAAVWAERAGAGLFNAVSAPAWAAFALAVIALDFAVWLQHVASHRVPWLWRLHRVHHADRDLDVTTALRFHPIEIALSAAYKSAVVVALGAPALAVVAFEAALNGFAMFNHANVALPAGLDRALRPFVVTPDMHRVHHSVLRDEHDRNFGFCLSLWDRLFGTYRAQPAAGHASMTIGLAETQDARPQRLVWSLAFPFAR